MNHVQRSILLVVLLTGTASAALAQTPNSTTTAKSGTEVADSDAAAIKQTALDYIEGWYDGNAERMERALHPDLAKRIIYTDAQSGRSRLEQMSALGLFTQEMPSSLTADTWHEDLLYLRSELPQRHKDLFHAMTHEQFADAVSSLDSRLSELSRAQIIVEIARIMAMIGDGHSGIRNLTDPTIGFRSYPLKICAFKDGIFVQSVEQAFAQIVGARLVRIEATPADEAFKKVAELVPRDNQMTVRNLAPLVLMQAEVLQALGIVRNPERAEFTFEKDGVQQTVILAPMKPGVTVLKTPSHWIDARAGSPTPLWLQDVDSLY